MIRFTILVFLSISLVQCSSAQEKSDGIFREISIWPNGEVSLGENFEQKDDISKKIADATYSLNQGSFGGAQSIIVFLDKQEIVQEIKFVYSSNSNFEEKVASYSESLGKPANQVSSDTLESRIWEDSETTFKLAKEKSPNKTSIYSVLKNKQ